MSRIESLPYSLSNADLKHLLGLALCESAASAPVRMARAPRSRTKRRRRPNKTWLNLCWNAGGAQVHFGE